MGFFTKIAQKLGLEVKKKEETTVNYDETGINPTAIGSAVITNIAIDDSDIIVSGNNARAEAIRELVDYFTEEVQDVAVEVALGTGDSIVRPYTDGRHIGFNVIGNQDFVVTESIGNNIKGIIIKIDEYSTNTSTYRLFETQTLDEELGLVYIRHFAYKDDSQIELSKTDWQNEEEETILTSNQLLFGRYKCPTINRKDYNSTNGVPITFGCESIVDNVKKQYAEYNKEFERKRTKIFADRTMFRTSQKDGVAKLVMDDSEFVTFKGDLNSGVSSKIQEFSPAIREAEYKAGEDFNLSILELCCGFSRGIFTKPETSFATATEMKNSLKKTFAFVKKLRRKIERGNKMLFRAVDIIMNINNITPMGEWEITHDWSYDYIEETKERFTQLLQGKNIGAVSVEEVRSWVMNEDIEVATEKVEEMEQKNIKKIKENASFMGE